MSVEVMSLVWKAFPGAGTELLTMLACADWCNDAGGSLFPSIATVAQRTRVSESQARRNMHALIQAGWLEVVGNAKGGLAKGGRVGAPRHYQLNVERLRAHAHAVGNPRMDDTLPAREALAPTCKKGRTHAREGSHSYDTRSVINRQENRQEEQETTARSRTAKDARPRFDPSTADLVQDLDREVLQRFAEHREEIGKPITTGGWEELRCRLQDLWDKGADVNDALRTAMAAGYPLPPDPRRGKAAVIERRQEREEEATASALAWHDRNMPPSRPDREVAWTC